MILVKCPNCKKEIEWSEKFPFRPFCSERCKLIDLGAWADNSYSMPIEAINENNLESSNRSDQNPDQHYDPDHSAANDD